MNSVALAIVHIGVFSLFHPRELVVTPAADSVLEIEAGGERLMLEGSAGARLRWSDQGVRATVRGHEFVAEVVRVIPRRGSLVLSVPGKIKRRFEGVMSVTGEGGLTATIAMPLETAVASVVAAESRPGAVLEALKAQAVAARSYYAGGTRHSGAFDFCDTTHCQFLRSRPEPESPSAQAARLRAVWSWPLPGRSCNRFIRRVAEGPHDRSGMQDCASRRIPITQCSACGVRGSRAPATGSACARTERPT